MRSILVLFLLVTVSGCFKPSEIRKQTITVKTPKVEGASCSVTDTRLGRWFLGATPGVITVDAGYGPLTVICEKAGYEKVVIKVPDERVLLDQMGMMEEVLGVVLHPTAAISKRYPYEIVVWLPKKNWKDEEEKRDWLLEKQLYDNEQLAIQKAKEEEARQLKEKELELRVQREQEYKERMQTVQPPERLK